MRIARTVLSTALWLVIAGAALKADPIDNIQANRYNDLVYRASNGVELRYAIWAPSGYKEKNLPMFVYMHGGWSTKNYRHKLVEAVNLDFTEYPCIVVEPQCPGEDIHTVNSNWINKRLKDVATFAPETSPGLSAAVELFGHVRKHISIDSTRMYITGVSNGGVATWDIITRNPAMFAAAVPVCGAGAPSEGSRLINQEIWAFHGKKDATIPVTHTRQMIAAIGQAGGDPKYTEYPTVGHDVWDTCYVEPELMPWIFSRRLGSVSVAQRSASGIQAQTTPVSKSLLVPPQVDRLFTIDGRRPGGVTPRKIQQVFILEE